MGSPVEREHQRFGGEVSEFVLLFLALRLLLWIFSEGEYVLIV